MKKRFFFILVIILTLFLSLTSGATVSDNPIEVEEGGVITYYLHVRYDGVDREGVQSSDSVTSTVYSDYIYVEDRIPDGLSNISVVQTEDGSIGAQDGLGNFCAGEVIGGVEGVVVDTTTNTVSFKVYGLKAGCTLSVGINATVPTVAAGERKDFFNVATATEGIQTAISNVVHTWVGKASVPIYKVTYMYEGDVPDGATPLPTVMTYAKNNVVRVMADGVAEGYTFSGWTTTDATIDSNDTFVMPAKDVILYGSFEKIDDSEMRKVTYEIIGEGPENYLVPKEKTYYKDTVVAMDTLKKGDIYNGYRFLGWTIDGSDINVTFDDNGLPMDFIMPDRDVVIQGSWELVKYKVSYQFYLPVKEGDPDYTLPWDSYLPDELYFRPGDVVSLQNVKGSPEGYEFVGWLKEDNFIMPSEDVVVYGEWQKITGTFDPVITKEIVNEKNYYQPGDIIQYKITVTNDDPIDINSVYVMENKINAYFTEGEGYVVEDDQIVFIENLLSGASVVLNAEYLVTGEDTGTVDNEVEIVGALSNDYYLFDTTKDYTARASANLKARLEICKNVNKVKEGIRFQFEIQNDTASFKTWMMLEPNQCMSVYLEPGSYNVTEVVPQDYLLDSIVFNNTSVNVQDFVTLEAGGVYKYEFTNKFFLRPFYHSFGRVVNRITQGG